MAAFAEALYAANKEPLHLVLDEADLWAPQRPIKGWEGLLGHIEEIVRRGRVRGFIPWLITQRPAVVHKDVLSQADILIAMKLTASQDRDAIGAWIEGQADRQEGKRILGELPRLKQHGEAESEQANWHAHLLITTRRLDGDQFAAKKARDLDPEVRRAGDRAIVADGEAWGELWRDHQNRYFREHGIDLQVDPIAAHPMPHIGSIRMRVAGSEIVERAEQIRQANDAAAHDPDQVLTALTRHNATFTAHDLDRFLAKHLADETERAAVKKRCRASASQIDRALRPRHQREGRAVYDSGGARTGTEHTRRCRGPRSHAQCSMDADGR